MMNGGKTTLGAPGICANLNCVPVHGRVNLVSESAQKQAVVTTASTFLNILGWEWAKVVIVHQLITAHDVIITGKQSHAWLAAHNPFRHSAIWLASLIREPSKAALGRIGNHVLVKEH